MQILEISAIVLVSVYLGYLMGRGQELKLNLGAVKFSQKSEAQQAEIERRRSK